MTTISLSYRAVHHKIKLLYFPNINWKMVYALGILLCLSLSVFYIFYVNQLTQGAYLVKNYNKEITSLLKENKILEADFAKTGFLDYIQDKVKELGFEKTSQVKYVEILKSSLAKAN